MAKSLGIFVSSDKHIEKIIKICGAAKKRGIELSLFFTHEGVRLTQDPRFVELAGLKMSVCKVGFDANSLRPPVPGISDKDYATQAMHAEMVGECDRYLVF